VPDAKEASTAPTDLKLGDVNLTVELSLFL